jgi:hypothetical protein
MNLPVQTNIFGTEVVILKGIAGRPARTGVLIEELQGGGADNPALKQPESQGLQAQKRNSGRG